MTQYQGPVTIYQYMDATVEARSMQANGGGMSNSPHTGVTGLLMEHNIVVYIYVDTLYVQANLGIVNIIF